MAQFSHLKNCFNIFLVDKKIFLVKEIEVSLKDMPYFLIGEKLALELRNNLTPFLCAW